MTRQIKWKNGTVCCETAAGTRATRIDSSPSAMRVSIATYLVECSVLHCSTVCDTSRSAFAAASRACNSCCAALAETPCASAASSCCVAAASCVSAAAARASAAARPACMVCCWSCRLCTCCCQSCCCLVASDCQFVCWAFQSCACCCRASCNSVAFAWACANNSQTVAGTFPCFLYHLQQHKQWLPAPCGCSALAAATYAALCAEAIHVPACTPCARMHAFTKHRVAGLCMSRQCTPVQAADAAVLTPAA